MRLFWEFPPGWWIVTAIFYLAWFLLFLLRKTYNRKRELRSNLLMGLVAVLVAIVIEKIGISQKLWTYFPGNWPIILWINYFGSGLLGYQLVKKVEEFWGK